AGQQTRVFAGAVDRLRDVVGDVARRLALDEVLGHRAFGVGDLDLAFDGAAHGAALQAGGDAGAERFVEVGSDEPLGVGARERVAGPALGDEGLLALDLVGVVGALHRAPGRRDRSAGERARYRNPAAQRTPTGAQIRAGDSGDVRRAHPSAEHYPNAR